MQPRSRITFAGCFLVALTCLLLTFTALHRSFSSTSTSTSKTHPTRHRHDQRSINPPVECLKNPRELVCFRLLAQCTESSLVDASHSLSWWFLANHVTEWVRLDRLLGRDVYREEVMEFFKRTSVDLKRFLPGVENDFNDDALWWMLALLEVYETYFEEAVQNSPVLSIRRDAILDTFLVVGNNNHDGDMVAMGSAAAAAAFASSSSSSFAAPKMIPFLPPAVDPLDFLKIPIQAWFMLKQTQWDTDRCYAGMFWRQNREEESGFYKATIANALYLALSTKLYRISQRDWFVTHQVPWTIRTEWLPRLESAEGGLYLDGVDTASTETCNVRPAKFTYNSAVVIGALLDLWLATNNTEFLRQATEKSTSALAYFANEEFLLPPETNVAANEDGVLFKAIFVRNLGRLSEWISAMPDHRELSRNLTTFFHANTDALMQASDGGRCTWSCDWRGSRTTRSRNRHAPCQLAASSLFHANIFLSL